MQKLGLPSMRSLDQLRSLSGGTKSFSFSSRPSSDSISLGSFANLKLTAEKLVKEQASVKTDLEMANSKLKKSVEHIRSLEDKLQNAFNENAKLKVKQREDEKLWKGLESKFSSTRTLCDQLTETLQHLACQVQDAEKDKESFEGKLSASSEAVDSLNQHMHVLSQKLSSAEETINNCEKELNEIKTEKEEKDKFYKNEQNRTAIIMKDKDAIIEKFETTIAENRLARESLNSKLGELHLVLRKKEDEIKQLVTIQENLEKQKSDLQLSTYELGDKLVMSHQENRRFEDFIHKSAIQLVELDKQGMNFIGKLDQLCTLQNSCLKLFQQEKDISGRLAQKSIDQLHDKFLSVTHERDALQFINQELNDKILELEKDKESLMTQFSEECHLAGDRIQRLESEVESLMSKKTEGEILVSKLEEKIKTLSESLRSSENKMQDLLLKISDRDVENGNITKKMQAELQRKEEEIDALQKESEKHHLHVNSLEKQVSDLQNILEEKEKLALQLEDSEKKLEEQIKENQASRTAAESNLAEAKKQNEQILESKQLELSRHLKEISQMNDQAINDIRRKYEVEKLEIVNMEKEKADILIREMELKSDKQLAEFKEESRQQLIRVMEEHAAMVICAQQEHDKREINAKAEHKEELKRVQLQAENELREKLTSLRSEHEVQMKALRCQHEDECLKLQEALYHQKSKEDRQRALLQLQWKVMGDKPQEEREVNSKQDYSISSIKMRDSDSCGGKRSHHTLAKAEIDQKVTATPVSKILKRVEDANGENVLSIPKRHKKVTHHEYKIETNNGRTITKRRQTKSTVMFEDPRKHRNKNTPKANTPRTEVKGVKARGTARPSNIGDLFSEGSLNPYADDPYAFD